ncbi:MAG: hypothetical protein PHU88_11780 [candidate division Zixibacteria bacterium]|nr:hypothetical protein [candidate division Zixibacteria bacterium]MDD5427397.1 hypothetical protein [candidate division Zixibacteria bacterium]
MSGVEIFQLWLEAFITLAILSFLYKDNPIYHLVESVFAGLSAGYYIGLYWKAIILQQLWEPMTRADNPKWWLFIPGLFGLMMFTRLWPKYSWISRIALAFVMGSTAGVFLITQLHGLVLPQMQKTMLPLVNSTGPGASFLAVIVVIGVISTLIYFYFSKEHKGFLGATARVGIWFIMISFGAHFGYTVMGRVSLLIGRVQFLIEDWIGSF